MANPLSLAIPAGTITLPPKTRDLRLDFFRGLALWLIFLNHVPSNFVGWFTTRNFGFSDAAEMFVFISGYTAAFVYGRVMLERGFTVAGARILKRAWQIYVAFIFLFMIYLAQISWVSARFENPLYVEEMNLLHFLQRPEVVIVEALFLRFLPANVDVLPLYIVLMAVFPLILWLLLRAPNIALGLSFLVYLAARYFGWNLPGYPADKTWFFSPFAWQFLFVIGAWCGVGAVKQVDWLLRSNWLLILGVIYLLFACGMQLSANLGMPLEIYPDWLLIFPLDKTGLDPFRLAHFLVLTAVVVRFVPADAQFLRSEWAKPLILCGEHSLEIFCLGVFLSFTAHILMIEMSARIGFQVLISLAGILIMIALAGIMTWYKKMQSRAPKNLAA
ncbi:MAG TPA: OpgC domain-containing protein [Xanthobacteraceae bacterium]|nr:OpgC domain-containing protein [Xanthobacteraceae bacterium]